MSSSHIISSKKFKYLSTSVAIAGFFLGQMSPVFGCAKMPKALNFVAKDGSASFDKSITITPDARQGRLSIRLNDGTRYNISYSSEQNGWVSNGKPINGPQALVDENGKNKVSINFETSGLPPVPNTISNNMPDAHGMSNAAKVTLVDNDGNVLTGVYAFSNL